MKSIRPATKTTEATPEAIDTKALASYRRRATRNGIELEEQSYDDRNATKDTATIRETLERHREARAKRSTPLR